MRFWNRSFKTCSKFFPELICFSTIPSEKYLHLRMSRLRELVAGGFPCFGETKQPKKHRSGGNADPPLPTAANPAGSTTAKNMKNSEDKNMSSKKKSVSTNETDSCGNDGVKENSKSVNLKEMQTTAAPAGETRRRRFGEILIGFFCCCCCCGFRRQPRNVQQTETKEDSYDEPNLDVVKIMPPEEPSKDNDQSMRNLTMTPDSKTVNLLTDEPKNETNKDLYQDSFKEDHLNTRDDDELTRNIDNDTKLRRITSNDEKMTPSQTLQSFQSDNDSSLRDVKDEERLKILIQDCKENGDSLQAREILGQETELPGSCNETSDLPEIDIAFETGPPVPIENFDHHPTPDSDHKDRDQDPDPDHTVDLNVIKIDCRKFKSLYFDDLASDYEDDPSVDYAPDNQELSQDNVPNPNKDSKDQNEYPCREPLFKALQESDPEQAAALQLHIRTYLEIPDGSQYPYNDICEYVLRSNGKNCQIPEFIYPNPIQPDPLLDLMNKMLRKKEKEKKKRRQQLNLEIEKEVLPLELPLKKKRKKKEKQLNQNREDENSKDEPKIAKDDENE